MERCISCSLTGPDVATCGNFMTCPKATRPVDPLHEVTIRCDLCDITRTVAIDTIMRGKDLRVEHSCLVQECKGFIVRPPAKDSVNATGLPPKRPAKA